MSWDVQVKEGDRIAWVSATNRNYTGTVNFVSEDFAYVNDTFPAHPNGPNVGVPKFTICVVNGIAV